MVEISSNLKKLLYSNTLPKAGIKISIKKTNQTYGESGLEYKEEEVMSFTEKDITNLNLSQSVDITGAELPSIKLNWEQNYVGEVDEQLRPIDYYGVSEKMAVDFSVIYDYLSYILWKSFYEKSETWSNIYSSSKTWRDVFYSKEKEEIKQKRTFLSAFPQVQGEKIKWESRDLLYYLNGQASQYTNFFITGYSIDFSPVDKRDYLVRSILGIEGLRLFSSNDKSIKVAINNPLFDGFENDKNALLENQIFVGISKDVIKNCLSPINYFIDFSKDKGSLFLRDGKSVVDKKFLESERKLLLKNQTNFPKITIGTNISSYIFDTSIFFVDYDDSYSVSASEIIYEQGEGYTSHIFYTDGSSTRFSKDGSTYPQLMTNYTVYEDLNYIRYDVKGEWLAPFDLKLYRIKPKSTTTTHTVNEIGTEFEEKNNLNPFSSVGDRNFALDRANFLSSYYNSKNSSVVVNCFGDPSIEPCDLISVETNLKNKNTGENIIKKGIVTSTELSYNGAIKETITIHELN